jgi:hypothetical protein
VSFRKRLIPIFSLKRADWDLQGRKIGTSGQDGWVSIAPPLRQPGEVMEYLIIMRKRWRKVPGPRGGITHGKPGKAWKKVSNQRHGGPATTKMGQRRMGPRRTPQRGTKLEVQRRSKDDRSRGMRALVLARRRWRATHLGVSPWEKIAQRLAHYRELGRNVCHRPRRVGRRV